MSDLGFAVFWMLMGGFLTVGGIAWCIKKEEGIAIRATIGDALQTIGRVIAEDAKSPKNN